MSAILRHCFYPFVRSEVSWRLLNGTVLRLARKMDFWRKCHVEGEVEVKQEGLPKAFADGVVQHGLFAGMKYPSLEAAGSALFPKLLGTYELELGPVMQRIVQTPYDTIVDVGCAEGYYANGLALRIPGARVYAFDVSPRARELCREMAVANGVADRVEIRAACTPDELIRLPLGNRALIVSDCEGYEHHLFTEECAAALRLHDVLIEVHAFTNPDIPVLLRRRFRATHHIQSITSTDDADKPSLCPWPGLGGYAEEERRALLAEGRPAFMEWLWMTPLSAG